MRVDSAKSSKVDQSLPAVASGKLYSKKIITKEQQRLFALLQQCCNSKGHHLNYIRLSKSSNANFLKTKKNRIVNLLREKNSIRSKKLNFSLVRYFDGFKEIATFPFHHFRRSITDADADADADADVDVDDDDGAHLRRYYGLILTA